MRLVDPRAIIEKARQGGYAIGAYNMHNDETCEALVMAAEQAKSPVILQVGRAIIPHMGVKRGYELTKRIAERSDADVVIHLDHGSWDEVIEAIRLGFTSIMYDGAHLPFEEKTIAACPHQGHAPKRSSDLEPAIAPGLLHWAVKNCQFMRERFTIADLLTFAGRWEDEDVARVLQHAEEACAAAEARDP